MKGPISEDDNLYPKPNQLIKIVSNVENMNKNSSKQIKRGINSSVKKVYKGFVSRISTGLYGGSLEV